MKSQIIIFMFLSFPLTYCSNQLISEGIEVNKVFDGERIDGPANIRENINGEKLFELLDNVKIQSTDFENHWCEIGLYIKLNQAQFKTGTIEVGETLYNIDGTRIGKTFAPLTVYTDFVDQKDTIGFISGFTHEKNVKPESLIEIDLENYSISHTRELNDYEAFIEGHKLRNEPHFLNFTSFYYYENWITDPSPGFRICLLFNNDQLQGVLHSRLLHLENTKTYKLDRGYEVSFYSDFGESEQLEFVQSMNEWLNGVD